MEKVCFIRQLLPITVQSLLGSWEGKRGGRINSSGLLLLLSSSAFLMRKGAWAFGDERECWEPCRKRSGGISWDIWRRDGGNVGAQTLGLQRGKESTLVRRGDKRDVPGWVRGNEGANKSDIKACLLWGSTVGKKTLWFSVLSLEVSVSSLHFISLMVTILHKLNAAAWCSLSSCRHHHLPSVHRNPAHCFKLAIHSVPIIPFLLLVSQPGRREPHQSNNSQDL